MITDLEELKQKRQKYIEGIRENEGFEEGIKRLLTELYPDNAHFIYELLQNAEDTKATEVSFNLTTSAVEFEHNGKRLFTLKDVDAITNIGNSPKLNDPTSIGRFGVGFKAVFAYTTIPEIHSGDFHFYIHDLVVPETKGVPPLNCDQKTLFILPLNNPKKPTTNAIKEIEAGLRNLGDNTLLFLNHIRKITYVLPDGARGNIERIDHVNGRIEIRAEHPQNKQAISHWLHFQKEIEVIDDDDDGKQKTCAIAIAYNVVEEQNKKAEDKFWKINPVHGQVSIFFPAEKETSNLRFHIHAPFASTVARDSVRECKANHQLSYGIAELIAESLLAIRDQGLLTVNFLAVLPNPADNLSGSAPFYEPIRLAIIKAFKYEYLTPTRDGVYAPATLIYRGPSRIAEVLDNLDLSILTGIKMPRWVANPPQQNQREDRFLDSLEIAPWGWTELAKSFCTTNKDKKIILEKWLEQKNDLWLMNLYALLGEACSSQKQTVLINNLRIVRVETEHGDHLVIPSQAFFPPTENIITPLNTYLVKKSSYDYSGGKVSFQELGSSVEKKRRAKLFLEVVGVKPFDTEQAIKHILDLKNHPDEITAEYWDNIRMFVDYWRKNPISNVEIFKNKIFLRGESKDGIIIWCKPQELYMDLPFSDTGLKELFNQEEVKFDNYKIELLKDYYDIPHFTDFAIAVGVMDGLEIRTHDATAMQSECIQRSGKASKHTENKDFYINALNPNNGKTYWHSLKSPKYIGELPIYKKNIALSRAVWNTICRAKPEQLTAHFVPNKAKKHLEKKTAAFFIKQLSDCAWIPDRAGNFLKPADVSYETLHHDFNFDNSNGWLTAVKFGENEIKRSVEYLAQIKNAKQNGFESPEVMVAAAAYCAKLKMQGKSPKELKEFFNDLVNDNKVELPEELVEPRRKKALENSRDAPSKESIMRERSIQTGLSEVKATAKAYLRWKNKNSVGDVFCQCCSQVMPFKLNGEYYFEAVQCVKNQEKRYHENYLALCPNCAALYQYGRETDDDEIQRLLVNQEVSNNTTSVEISVKLASKIYKLRFVATHWFDLKECLKN